MKYRKPIVITLAVLALIIVSSMLLMRPVELFLSKNLPLTDLKLELVRQVREGTGIEVSIKGARYEFLHGVVMSGVSARIGTGPVFFHGDNLIVHVSLLEAMKKNFRPRIRLLGGRLLLSQIERNQLLEMLKLLDKSKSGDWAIEAEGISLEKPADLMLKFSLEPGGKEVTGKIALTLNGKKVIKGEVKAVGPRAGMSYRIFDLPLVMIDDFLPSLLDGAHGTLDGRGSFSVDEMGLAYDFKGDADRFEIPLAPGWTIDPEITINGGQLWKDNIRLTANFTLKHHDIEMQMQEKLLLPGLASREIKGYWNRAPWFTKGKLGFELKSKFRAAYRDTEQFEEAKFQLTSAEMEPFKGLKIEVEDASLSLGSEIKFAGHGKLAGHAFKLGGLGAFRFGDAFPSMGSGPITLDGEIDSLQPQAIMDAATSVHSDLMKRGYTEDAERAEDSGPLWTQRRKQNTLVTTLLAGFAVQGIVNIKGIQGVTQDPIQIFVQKTAGSMSARLAYEKETFNFKAEYSIGFDADLPHQNVKVNLAAPQNPMSLLYFTGNPDPAGPFSIDYNASADGLFPADLVYKSQSNLFFKMKGLNPKNLNPAPLLLSMAGLKEIVLDDFEIQRVTEGGRTVWSQIKASKQEISVIGSAEFSSQEGGKGSFFIQGPAAYSKRMDLGITEAGKWYPREN